MKVLNVFDAYIPLCNRFTVNNVRVHIQTSQGVVVASTRLNKTGEVGDFPVLVYFKDQHHCLF